MLQGFIVIGENLPYILGGIWVTLTVVVGALILGLMTMVTRLGSRLFVAQRALMK